MSDEQLGELSTKSKADIGREMIRARALGVSEEDAKKDFASEREANRAVFVEKALRRYLSRELGTGADADAKVRRLIEDEGGADALYPKLQGATPEDLDASVRRWRELVMGMGGSPKVGMKDETIRSTVGVRREAEKEIDY